MIKQSPKTDILQLMMNDPEVTKAVCEAALSHSAFHANLHVLKVVLRRSINGNGVDLQTLILVCNQVEQQKNTGYIPVSLKLKKVIARM